MNVNSLSVECTGGSEAQRRECFEETALQQLGVLKGICRIKPKGIVYLKKITMDKVY